MSKRIDVYGDMTINGESGSYHQLQSNRVDNQGGAAGNEHRHFEIFTGKLTLNHLKLTWGEIGSSGGGFIYMYSGTLAINWIHFDGRSKTTGSHAGHGGCLYVNDGKVTIKDSTFEGFRVSTHGGAIYVTKTSIPLFLHATANSSGELN